MHRSTREASYEKLGFVAEGPVFDEVGMPHQRMVIRL